MKKKYRSPFSTSGYVFFFIFLIFSKTTLCGVLIKENKNLPTTTFNLTFNVGSAYDLSGMEGMAYLTGRLLREGGVKAYESLPARSREELEEFLFPLSADIDVSIQKEQISFRGTTSSEDALQVFQILSQMLMAPELNLLEFERIRLETLDALKKQWPREDEEELGKAALENMVFGEGHPYSHIVMGTIKGISSIKIENIRNFIDSNFGSRRLTLGVAGVVSQDLKKSLYRFHSALRKGSHQKINIPETKPPNHLKLLIIKGPFDATGVHLGLPLPVRRGHPDFPALYLASTAFGKHRSFVGRLMREVREIRGLNYGTYSYVEDFPNGGKSLIEPTQVSRQSQAFTVWGRPTPIENGCFLLRQLVREVSQFSSKGLTQEEFDLIQSHLVGSIPLMATGIERSLGYAIDSLFYNIQGEYLSGFQSKIRSLKLKKVNDLISRTITPSSMNIVVVTRDPEQFKKEILGKTCGIHYPKGIEKPKEILDEDKLISSFAVPLKPENITIKNSEVIFEG